MSLSAHEKIQIIKRLNEHTAVAEYAFKNALKKRTLSEEELLFLERNIEIITVLKPVIKANRQGQKDSSKKNNKRYREEAKSANDKVQELEKENFSLKQKVDNLFNELLDIKNSEIYRLGKWLKEALLKTGTDRDNTLREKELVHKNFYNKKIKEAEDESRRRDEEDRKIEEEYKTIVNNLQERIDYLREVIKKVEKFMIDNHGQETWKDLIK